MFFLCLNCRHFFTIYKSLLLSIETSLDKEKVLSLLPSQIIFCLDSALNNYSNYYRSNRICLYADLKTAQSIQKSFFAAPSSKTIINVYSAKPELLPSEIVFDEVRFTSKSRTVLNLFADSRQCLRAFDQEMVCVNSY